MGHIVEVPTLHPAKGLLYAARKIPQRLKITVGRRNGVCDSFTVRSLGDFRNDEYFFGLFFLLFLSGFYYFCPLFIIFGFLIFG